MNEAGQLLLGQHDFASFGKPPQGSNTIRIITQAKWFTNEDNQLIFSITANAFLYRMVRNIVGTLVEVGLGRLAITDIRDILEAQNLTRSASPVPAHGLCLVDVAYPED
jgi:tRNA pseudouridine38-40 synthase